MRLDPSTERAVRFAARTGDGPLADGLARHERANTMDRPAGSGRSPASGSRGFRPSIGQRRSSERRHQRRPSVEGGVWTARSMQQFPERRTDLPPSSGKSAAPSRRCTRSGCCFPCAHCSPSGGCRDGRPNRSRRRRGAVPRRAAGGTARGVGMAALPSPGRVRAPRVSTKTTRMSRRGTHAAVAGLGTGAIAAVVTARFVSSPDGPLRSQGSASEPASRCSLPFTAAERCCRTSVPSSAPSQTR